MNNIEINSKKYGKFIVLVDEDDFYKLSKYKWNISKGTNTFYAVTKIKKNSKFITVKMHRMIVDYDIVDHKDRNGLNNKKENLRPSNKSLNAANRVRAKTKSGYAGVYIINKYGNDCYFAQIAVDMKTIYLGSRKTAKECAVLYNEAAKKYFGDFAVLNKID